MAEPDKLGQTVPKTKTIAAPTKLPNNEGNPVFRMMGLPRLRAKLPSRNWLIFLSITGSLTTAILYDRHHKKKNQQKWCSAVSHLSTEALPTNRLPRKITVFLAAPPGDGLRSAREYFQDYVKPVLVAAAVDWDVVEGRREGEVRAGLAERIRKMRQRNGEFSLAEQEEDAVATTRQKTGIQEADDTGGDLVIGRHTWKEYVRGLHEGWLGPLDEPQQSPSESSSESPSELPLEPPLESSSESLDEKKESEETKTEQEKQGDKQPEEEKPKPKPKPTVSPPYILPSSYSTSTTLTTTLPSTLSPSTALPFPHILGFLNTPVRSARFLNRRHQAETTGHLVASFLLSPDHRPYNTTSTLSSSPDWEQQILLEHEEQDWHKSARAPNPAGEEEKERPWSEDMVVDERIGERMRTVEVIEEIGKAVERGNSREWKGGADRPEDVTWGNWARELVGLEVDDKRCKGWEQGEVDE